MLDVGRECGTAQRAGPECCRWPRSSVGGGSAPRTPPPQGAARSPPGFAGAGRVTRLPLVMRRAREACPRRSAGPGRRRGVGHAGRSGSACIKGPSRRGESFTLFRMTGERPGKRPAPAHPGGRQAGRPEGPPLHGQPGCNPANLIRGRPAPPTARPTPSIPGHPPGGHRGRPYTGIPAHARPNRITHRVRCFAGGPAAITGRGPRLARAARMC